ncbi:MAG: hypothetical protein QM778_25000 [Myxococcales bacterium]
MEKGTGKRAYVKPQLRNHGSVEQVTGWCGSSSAEFFGGPQGASHGTNKIGFHQSGPGISH